MVPFPYIRNIVPGSCTFPLHEGHSTWFLYLILFLVSIIRKPNYCYCSLSVESPYTSTSLGYMARDQEIFSIPLQDLLLCVGIENP